MADVTKAPAATRTLPDQASDSTIAHPLGPDERASVSIAPDTGRRASLWEKRKRKKRAKGDKHHSSKKCAFFRYCYYDPAFKYFIEEVLGAEYLPLPASTIETIEVGAQNSSDYVCTPFKHILGDYIEALDAGADVLVQFGGPCRLGYYGELQDRILRDMGYDFEMLNFSANIEDGVLGWAKQCMKVVNPNVKIGSGLLQLAACADMVVKLDSARDFYLANAGFERERGSYARVWDSFMEAMRDAKSERDISAAYRDAMDAFRAIPLDKPDDPIRIGVVGEMFTAIDERSNLELDEKLLAMGVEVHRMMNLTHRWIRYNEKNLRVSAKEYIEYDMGPTSTITIAAAAKFAREGFDGLIHAKSAGCTPEIDCAAVLQRIAQDYEVPCLYLTYDAQTSDTGLDTRLEAFYDMLAMKKERRSR